MVVTGTLRHRVGFPGAKLGEEIGCLCDGDRHTCLCDGHRHTCLSYNYKLSLGFQLMQLWFFESTIQHSHQHSTRVLWWQGRQSLTRYVPPGVLVGFRIGMLSTARWLKTVQRAKKGVETIHLAKFWRKIGIQIWHFLHFCSNVAVETKQNFQRPEKVGGGRRNGGVPPPPGQCLSHLQNREKANGASHIYKIEKKQMVKLIDWL